MPLTDRSTPAGPRPESTVDPVDADHVRTLLHEARLVESAFEATPAPAAAPAAPTVPVPPPGYTLKTVHHTTPDGGSRVEYEVVPLAPLAPAGSPARAGAAERRSLPQWLTTNGRKLKAATYLAGGGALVAGAALYGPAIGAGIGAAAAGVWAAVVTALKVIGVALVGLVVLGVVTGGRADKKKSGTFEFSGTGTWKEN